MADRVAEIEVYAGLEDRDLIAGLRRAEAEVERTAAKIRGERAEAKIGLDLSEFKRKIKEAQAELKRFEARQADASLTTGQRRYARERATALSKEIAALGKAEAAAKQNLQTLKSQNAEIKRGADLEVTRAKAAEVLAKKSVAAEKRRAAEAEREATKRKRATEAQGKTERDIGAAHERALKENARREAAIVAARERALNDQAKAERGMAAAHERALKEDARLELASERAAISRAKAQERARVEGIIGAAKERAEIVKLQRQYAKLTDQAEKIARRRAYLPESRRKLTLDTEGIYAEMELTKAKLQVLGEEPPIGIHVEMERRKSLPRMKRAALQFGDIFRFIAEKAANLGSIAVRVGPFTASLKQLAVALGFLGPILISLVGAAGALVGVIGTGLAGAATVGAAGLLGLGLAFGGLKMSLKSAAADYKLAQQATDAYSKAVAKHGKGSKEAKNAQEQMNNVLKSVSPLARESALGMQKFRDEWDKATAPTQESFGRIAKGYFGALNAIRPMWAKSTNDLSKILDTNLRGGFKFFKTPEFRKNFESITGNFNKSVPTFLHALGSMGRGFLNLAREGSKFLQPFAKSFDNLGEKFLKFTQRSDFDDTVKRWARHAADLGHFLGALGRVMMHFFGAGANAGDKFLVSMTKALDRWDRFLTSKAGANEIGDAFDRAVDNTKALWNILAPIAGLFVTWASEISPFITGLMQGVGFALRLFNAMSKLLGLGPPLATLGATIGAMWAIGKMGALVAMLARIPAILGAIRAQQGTLAAINAIATGTALSQARAPLAAGTAAAAARGVGAGTAAAAGVAAGRTATSLGKMSKAGNAAKGVLAGLGFVATGAASVMAGVGVAAIGAGAGMYLFMNRTRSWEKSARDADQAAAAMREGLAALDPSSTALAQSTLTLSGAQLHLKTVTKQSAAEQRELTRLQEQGKTKTEAYRSLNQQHANTLLDVQQAELNVSAASKARTQQERDNIKLQDQTLKRARQNLKERRESLKELGQNKDGSFLGLGGQKTVDAYRKISNAAKEAGVSVTEFLNRDKGRKAIGIVPGANLEKVGQYARKIEHLRNAQDALRVAEERVALATLNQARGMKGLVPIAQSAARAMATVAKLGGKNLATKISLQFQDPGQAQRVATSAAKTLKSGIPKQVVSKIVADSKDAEQAVRRLQSVRLTPKRLEIVAAGGQRAIDTVERLAGIKLTPKQQAIVERGGARAIGVLQRILGIKLPGKNQQVRESGASAVLSVLASIRALSLPDKHQRITIETLRIERVRRTSSASPGADTGRRAKGQRPHDPGLRLIGEGAADEWRVNAATGEGYKTDGPEFTRLGAQDAIIPTEPKYKQRGRDIFKQIARDLGIAMHAAGKNPISPFGSFKGAAFNPKAVITPERKFKPAKKRSGAIASRRSWATYIEGLQTQQGYWEREVGIRESQVKEPEDMVVRDPTNDTKVVDPTTGETTNVEAFKANPEIETSYKPSLQLVLEAMKTLMSIVAELVRAIPLAIQANRQERVARGRTVEGLKDDIHDDKRRISKTSGKSKEKNERNLEKHKEMLAHEQEVIKQLKEDEGTLKEGAIDAGFDYREIQIAKQARQDEYNTASGRAAARAAEQTAEAKASAAPSGSGGSGGGSDASSAASASEPLSIEAQTALALTQNAETLKAFGSNFIGGANNALAQFAAGAVAGAGTGFGSSTSANSANIGVNSAGAALDSSRTAGTYMTQSGAASGGSPAPSAGLDSGGGTSSLTVNNTFMAPPPDPHTWSAGVEYELGATL